MPEDCLMGWDASWTPQGSGAWCVLQPGGRGWRVSLLEPSPRGKEKLSRELSGLLKGMRPSLVAVDMPVADHPVTGYREADRATARAFSRFGCPVHSPTPDRPGDWGRLGVEILFERGYHGLTEFQGDGCAFAEVYPHTALLKLLRIAYRFPYKSGRTTQYWPGCGMLERKRRLLAAYRRILSALGEDWGEVPEMKLPSPEDPLSHFKQSEDLLDALICAWCALQIRRKQFCPFGDASAAIWNPPLKELDLPASAP